MSVFKGLSDATRPSSYLGGGKKDGEYDPHAAPKATADWQQTESPTLQRTTNQPVVPDRTQTTNNTGIFQKNYADKGYNADNKQKAFSQQAYDPYAVGRPKQTPPPPTPQYGQPAPPIPQQYAHQAAPPVPQQYAHQPAPPPPQYAQPYGQTPPPTPQYGQPAPPTPQYSQPAPPLPQQYAQPAPPTPQYAQPAPPLPQQYAQPAPPTPQYAQPAPPTPQYAQPAPPLPQYGQPSPPPQQYPQQYAQPAPPTPQYSQPTPTPSQYAQPYGAPAPGLPPPLPSQTQAPPAYQTPPGYPPAQPAPYSNAPPSVPAYSPVSPQPPLPVQQPHLPPLPGANPYAQQAPPALPHASSNPFIQHAAPPPLPSQTQAPAPPAYQTPPTGYPPGYPPQQQPTYGAPPPGQYPPAPAPYAQSPGLPPPAGAPAPVPGSRPLPAPRPLPSPGGAPAAAIVPHTPTVWNGPVHLHIEGVSISFITVDGQQQHYRLGAISISQIADVITCRFADIECGHIEGSRPSFSSDPGYYLFREVLPPYRFVFGHLPQGCPQEQTLIDLLNQFSSFQQFERPNREELPESVQKAAAKSDKMKSGGQSVGKGIVTVSSGIGTGVKAGGKFYTKHTESGDSGEVDERTKQRIETTQKVGGTVAKGTSKALGGVAKGANFVGKKSKEGKPDKPKSEKDERNSQYASGAMAGGGAVFSGVCDGARIIGRDVKDTTVDVVEHKHGEAYADSTNEGFKAGGSVAVSAVNVSSLSTVWITAGINCAAGALSTEPARKLMAGASWKEGYLSILDTKGLGWTTKYVRLKSQAIVIYSASKSGSGEEPTGILPLGLVSGAKVHDLADPRWKKKPFTFAVINDTLAEWFLSVDCSYSDELKSHVLKTEDRTHHDPASELQDWLHCLNALGPIQNL